MKTSGIQIFLLLILFSNCCVGSFQHTWFEAQNSCRVQHKKLKTEILTNSGKYWSGYFKQMSSWIQLLGCYTTSVLNISIAKKKITMPVPSVGFCQKTCSSGNFNTSYFAIQNSTCVCLQTFVSINSSPPNQCNITCERVTGQPFSGECGGKFKYNVYSSVLEGLNESGDSQCSFIQCAMKSKQYGAANCGESYVAACEQKGTFVSNNNKFTDWTSAMAYCKKKNAYLVNNLSLRNLTYDCGSVAHVIGNALGQAWISVGRQLYVDLDEGHFIEPTRKRDFRKCGICENENCTFTDCNSPIDVTGVYCSNIPQTTSSTTKTSTETTNETTTNRRAKTSSEKSATARSLTSLSAQVKNVTFTTEEGLTKILNSMVSNERKHERNERSVQFEILVPVLVVVILIIVGVAFGSLVYKRRQKTQQNDVISGIPKFKPEKQHSKSIKTESDVFINDNRNLIFERKTCHDEVQDNNEQESPYDEEKDGTYDHLRDNESERKATDNVYHHATFVQNHDLSDYDFAGRSRCQEPDDTYDHANIQLRNSDYAYNTLQRNQENSDYA